MSDSNWAEFAAGPRPKRKLRRGPLVAVLVGLILLATLCSLITPWLGVAVVFATPAVVGAMRRSRSLTHA